MERVLIEGEALERGRQYGFQARTKIAQSVETYHAWFRDFAALGWEDAVRFAGRFGEFFERNHPALAQEMSGIAEGSGQPLEDIIALNVRTELAYGESGIAPSECSSLAIGPRLAEGGAVYVAENWDWLTEALDNTVLLHVRYPDGLEALTFTEAGMLAKFGVNSAGIALCNNLLATDVHQVGAAFHTLSRDVLRSRTLVGALWAVTGATRAGSGHYMVGSAEGEAMSLEWAPGDFTPRASSDGRLIHTNHFIEEPRGLRDRTKFLATVSPGTYTRLARLDAMMTETLDAQPRLGVDDIKRWLRDHHQWPDSICRHSEDFDGHRTLGQSNVSFIADLTRQEFHFTVGPPCRSQYATEAMPWSTTRVSTGETLSNA